MKWLQQIFQPKKLSHRERSPRIRLLLSDGARIETAEGAFPLLNLSESGIGFLAEAASLPTRVSGVLYLGDESLNVDLEVVRRNGGNLGARFMGDGAAIRAALRRQYNEEIRATEMSEVDPGHLSKDSSGTPRWFYAPSNYELFFLEDQGEITRLEIEWNGRVVACYSGEGPRAGTIDAEDRQKPGHAKSSLVKWEPDFKETDRAKAIRIIENVPGLDPVTRGRLVSVLRK